MASIPSKFKYIYDPTALSFDSFPAVDFSALSSDDPDQRSKAINDISKACEEWGFFILVNHGIAEELMNATFSGVKEFMSLGVGGKMKYAEKMGVDPMQYVGFDMSNSVNDESLSFWRERLWLDVHPKFHCPEKPQYLREAMLEYDERCREVSIKLMEAISNGLQLEHHYADQALGLDLSYQIVVANNYPPCPRPDQAIGIIPHTDTFLFTLLIHNGVSGFQIEHQGQWFNVDSPKDSILFNVSDQLENFSYKSLKHRVLVNEERERMSIAWQFGPSKEAIVAPASALLDKDGPAMYPSIKFQEFIERMFKIKK